MMPMRKILIPLVLLCSVLSCAALCGYGQSGSGTTLPKLKVSPHPPDYHPPQWWAMQKKADAAVRDDRWVHDPWTGNNVPYAAARRQIETAFAAGSPPQQLVETYQAVAEKAPQDALAQFRWGYAAHLAVDTSQFQVDHVPDYLFSITEALAMAPSPHVYDYDRLRFLLFVQGYESSTRYKTLATRLLQKDPHDYLVLVGLGYIEWSDDDPVGQKHDLALIQSIVKQYPNKPQPYQLMGDWYRATYLLMHHQVDYDAALKNYQQVVSFSPPGSALWSEAKSEIDFLTMRHHQITGE